MKLRFAFLGLLSLIAVSCSYEESFIQENNIYNSSAEFYATIDEQPDADTKVYADENLRVLWNADDRITIFNKNTFNQEYKFLGDDGDNAGAIAKVDNAAGSGAPLEHIYAVYPFVESTAIDASGTLSFTLLSEQSYHEKSFGIGANTMVSVTDDIKLRFKNAGGYMSLKFYGDGVSVSSIVLKGNNGELLSGPCSISTSGGIPAVTMSSGASDQVTLACDPPVELGATSSEAVQFIFVLPPVTLTEGFTVTVTTPEGAVFEKSSSNRYEIVRSAITKLGAMEVVPVLLGNIVFADPEVKRICVENWDQNGDGELSYEEAAEVADLGEEFYASPISIFDELLFFTGLTSISDNAFHGCNALSSIVIPNEVISIGKFSFFNCSSLSSIIIPKGLESIGLYAFHSCKNLTSFDIPESVTSIGDYAFYYCNSLTSIELPKHCLSIGKYAFSDCSRLTSITIPDGVTTIGKNAFQSSGLTAVVFPGSVALVEEGVFEDCSNLIAVDLSEGITSIGNEAFYGCNSLKSITIPSSVTSLGGYCFRNCTSLTSAILSEGLTSIGEYAFMACKSLTSIVIPSSVTTIGSAAFVNCKGLTSLLIPAGVTSIGETAFSGCSSLTEIECKSFTPPSGGSSMFTSTNNCPIYVPASSVSAYKTAEYWKSYASRITSR